MKDVDSATNKFRELNMTLSSKTSVVNIGKGYQNHEPK